MTKKEENEILFKHGLRKCTNCGDIKELSDFYLNGNPIKGLITSFFTHCKDCQNEKACERYHKYKFRWKKK